MAAVIWICYKTQHYFFYTYDFTASLKEQRCCLSLHFISFNFEMTIEGDVVPHGSVCQNKTTSKIRLDNSIVNMLKNAACRKKTLSIPLKWVCDSEQRSCDQVVFSCLPSLVDGCYGKQCSQGQIWAEGSGFLLQTDTQWLQVSAHSFSCDCSKHEYWHANMIFIETVYVLTE